MQMATIGSKMEMIEALPFLKSFMLVVENESFALAAKKLGMTKPAISKHISKLETIVGLQLLIRTTRRMSLTDAGAQFYEQCKQILKEIEEAQDILSEIHKEPKGRLKVVCARYFAKKYLIPHLDKFLRAYPSITLDLELAERMPDLEKEGVDIVIGMSQSAEGNTIQKRIMTTRYMFTASPKYLKKHGLPKHPKDLLKHHYITHAMRKPEMISPYLHINDVETMVELAVKGLGIIKTHAYMVEDAVAKGKLVEILADYSKEEVPIYVAYPQRRILSRKIRVFIDFIQSETSI